jgi:DNA-binding transcriptional ArsR family regulator
MSRKRKQTDEMQCCPSKPKLEERQLISPGQATELEALFKILGNTTRLRMLHALVRANDMTVTELSESVHMKPQAVSNQLQRLVDRGILASKRNGNNVHYRIIDPCVMNLLDQGLCLLEDAKERKV